MELFRTLVLTLLFVYFIYIGFFFVIFTASIYKPSLRDHIKIWNRSPIAGEKDKFTALVKVRDMLGAVMLVVLVFMMLLSFGGR